MMNQPLKLRTDLLKPVFFIINPEARNKGSKKVWEEVEGILQAKGVPYHYYFTERKGHALELARKIWMENKEKTWVIAVGGDGTLHEVIHAAAGLDHARVGCVPAGSGNDFSRGIQRTASAKAVMKLLLESAELPSCRIDAGVFETGSKHGFFVNSIGIGFDAEITYEAEHSLWKKRFNALKAGKLIYLITFIKKLFTYKRADMEVIIDGKHHSFRKVWFVVAANQPYFGGGIKISPHASPYDRQLNILAVHDLSHIKLLFIFITVFWGGHLKLKNVESFIGETMTIRSAQDSLIQADGEIIGTKELSVSLASDQISVLAKKALKKNEEA
ncbi:diacylglycerol kinase family protein [Bacillus sp. MUM 13]|uniref:diacylglycerol/lipid kinase family protein n=1 Tax=Bacillus sp. MUM 13 TaxID=1678001 RepID=UPI0008F59291|nr:diacylglycerol kinase family protein [Bacillus sp. MUM 13]OIK03412.1 hypothetical protein BIV59_22535 [Bacillus sp. MUM 13]